MGTLKFIPMGAQEQAGAIMDILSIFDGELDRLSAIVNIAKPADPRNRYEIVDYTPVTGDSLIPDGGGATIGETLNIPLNK